MVWKKKKVRGLWKIPSCIDTNNPSLQPRRAGPSGLETGRCPSFPCRFMGFAAFKEEPQSHTRSLRRCSDECDPSPFILPPVRVSYPLDSVITEARSTSEGLSYSCNYGPGPAPEARGRHLPPGAWSALGQGQGAQGTGTLEERILLYSFDLRKISIFQ